MNNIAVNTVDVGKRLDQFISEKEEITRVNACSQLYKKGGMEPPFQGTYATGFPRLNSPPDCSSNAKHCFLPFLVFVRQ